MPWESPRFTQAPSRSNTDAPDALVAHGLTVPRLTLDPSDALRQRYLGDATTAVYLIRPDQHVAARWTTFDESAAAAALGRAIGKPPTSGKP